jgi:5-hydroxyisourate hydrolase
MVAGIKRISTHVLDLALGKPAKDVAVRLEKQEPSGWRILQSQRTDQDGRCTQLLPTYEELSAGSYRLAFDVANYYAVQRVDALYPVVEITFFVRDGETQYHIPLLLSAHGYTTYRGS